MGLEMNGVTGYGYGYGGYSQVNPYNYERIVKFDPTKDFKPGLITTEEKEKKSPFKKLLGLAVLTAATVFFLRKTKKGGEILNKFKKALKNFIDTKKVAPQGTNIPKTVVPPQTVTVTPQTVTVTPQPKVKVPNKKSVVTQNIDLTVTGKTKVNGGGGKEVAHKVRHNKKQIIEAKRLQEEAEAFSKADVEAYHKTLATPATPVEKAFIENNNKVATNTIADVMEKQGLSKVPCGKDNAKIVKDTALPPKTNITVPKEDANLADKIAEVEAKIAKQQAAMKKFENPAMQKYAKPYEVAIAKLNKELEALQAQVA